MLRTMLLAALAVTLAGCGYYRWHKEGQNTEGFHRESVETQTRWPRTMLATSTHDTKRGEDVRARLALLSEIPERWSAAVERYFASGVGRIWSFSTLGSVPLPPSMCQDA